VSTANCNLYCTRKRAVRLKPDATTRPQHRPADQPPLFELWRSAEAFGEGGSRTLRRGHGIVRLKPDATTRCRTPRQGAGRHD
jgi:hypothetical protein